jgi:hypothetical protein
MPIDNDTERPDSVWPRPISGCSLIQNLRLTRRDTEPPRGIEPRTYALRAHLASASDQPILALSGVDGF